LNFIWIGIVYLVFPETSGRSLESIEAMFTTSPFYWQMEKAYAENQDMFANTHKHGIEGVDLAKEKQIDCSHEELPYVWWDDRRSGLMWRGIVIQKPVIYNIAGYLSLSKVVRAAHLILKNQKDYPEHG
jgi:hypothetical protein